jgi:putative phosphoribosyl transferase
MLFQNRREAGRALAVELGQRSLENAIVLALPRGGVPVAYEVAVALRAPLDVIVVRKLGVPGHEELAMGAVASGGVGILNESITDSQRIPLQAIGEVAERESVEVVRRVAEYRGGRPPLALDGRTAVLVDDGLATGASMRAAVLAARALGPSRIVVGVPVASREAVDELEGDVDEVVSVETPEPFGAVGAWYSDFRQTTDAEVRELLEATRFSPARMSAVPGG